MTHGVFHWIGRSALEVFRPKCDATSGEVRKSGAFGMALGLVLFVGSIATTAGLNHMGIDLTRSYSVLLLLSFPGFTFMVVGGFRVIAGQEPEQESSLNRIILGVIGGLFALFVLIVALVIVIVVSEALKR